MKTLTLDKILLLELLLCLFLTNRKKIEMRKLLIINLYRDEKYFDNNFYIDLSQKNRDNIGLTFIFFAENVLTF